MTDGPRIALIHALRDSMVPIWNAFSAGWPEAQTFNVLDDSLSADLAAEGELTDAIVDRFITLGRYAREAGANGKTTDAILFTCSAFGPAITAVKSDLDIPVFTPNEAAFEEALSIDGRIGLIVSFPPSEHALSAELNDAAVAGDVSLDLTSAVANGALAALQSGDGRRHDAIIAETAETMSDVGCIVLGQFSMAHAAHEVGQRVKVPVITTPAAAVARLRTVLAGP
ncbi:MAG: aspartate/glutamate racemase family protein [Rhodospirillaceae bacterium]|jgi:Asp/Glu/hydantoin racemase|nr:aspartate/glutamate racemase family protein [Rhodospirillaceae bacterium]